MTSHQLKGRIKQQTETRRSHKEGRLSEVIALAPGGLVRLRLVAVTSKSGYLGGVRW